ncbi:hypothetical protein NEMBOFW57_005574 [Staphylotrichum longicolle]|uniref:Uncharacterized protein n=1 Tax=Staphylotrichum longicolle TaxID=669026 RepID=A0AAD4EWY6_9PEZI|nr:hypothetical protein NEMBOFW57_005574 [Staphylotrichum longicolle]
MTQIWPAVLALALPAAATASTTPNYDCSKACATLATLLPRTPSPSPTPRLHTQNTYWSARQSEVHPACFVTRPRPPTSPSPSARSPASARPSPSRPEATPPSRAAPTSRGRDRPPARLREITVSRDRATSLGDRWDRRLDRPLGLAVVGGRSATVGVSGLTLGGGISYFSGARGWACDNVRRYEVVLASGRWWRRRRGRIATCTGRCAGRRLELRVVTRFDLAAFEQGKLWASSRVYPGAMNRTLIRWCTSCW